jgi:hypothetical protein
MGPDGRQRAAQGLSGHHGEVRLIIVTMSWGRSSVDSAVARTTPAPTHRARRHLASDDASQVISASLRYGSTVPNPCFKADVRKSVRAFRSTPMRLQDLVQLRCNDSDAIRLPGRTPE